MVLSFEYDPAKSEANRDKHGIDFLWAQALWDDRLCVVVAARSLGEERWAIIAKLQGKHWIAIFTMRGKAIRLISARRARDSEVQNYEETNNRRIGQEI